MDAEVREGRQALLVDRVPEAQFGGNAIVEPVEQRQAVASLGRRRQTEQLDGLDVLEERPVRGRRGVMELVDDDDVEVGGIEVARPAAFRLWIDANTCSNASRTMAARPTARRRRDRGGVAERRQALLEDLLPVRDEEQPRARQRLPKPRVVDRGHDGLAGSGRGDQQVAVVAALARQRNLLEQALLERLRPELDRAQDERRAPTPTCATSAANSSASYGTKSPLFQ